MHFLSFARRLSRVGTTITMLAFVLVIHGCSTTKVHIPELQPTGSRLVADLNVHHFPITTSSAEAQAWFNQGLLLLYGFNHGEAIRSFQEAARRDPEAAMPWWGIAYANGMHINNPEMTEEQWEAGHEASQVALALLDDETELEQALVRAVSKRNTWPAPEEQRPYDEAYAEAMEEVYNRFNNNPDVAVQFAESLMNLQPWDYWTEDRGPKIRTTEIVAAIEHAMEIDPQHPQAAHLYIHALEASAYPEKAEPAADMLRARTNGAGHLVHMPSHLYARVGRYADAVMANEDAIDADEAFFDIGTEPGFYYLYHAHNVHFLAFAAMMEGNYETAIAAARRLETSVPEPMLDQLAFIVEGIIPTSYHVQIRFGKWEDVLAQPAPADKRPLARAIHHYARGIAFAATGRTEQSRAESALFDQWIERVPDDWWIFNNKAHNVLPIGRLMLRGELAYREGRLDDAWAALEEAIALEDKLIYDEPPAWMIPVRHAMGALLLEAGQPARAEALYRRDQIEHPGNGWSLLGLIQSLEAQGRTAEATAIAPKLDKAWRRVEDRPTSSCFCAPGAS
jgi:tetratricopeptide (TPR) repeat protein